MTRWLTTLLVTLAAVAPSAQIALTEATCRTNGEFTDGPPAPTVPNGHIAWPADDPVWEFDLYRPGNRTTANGTGLELRDVRYQGRLVFARASVPVLNVEYDEGGCGCFRDWMTNEAPIEPGDGAQIELECFAESEPGDVITACEANERSSNPGGDAGDFFGVTVEDYGTELVLTGHAKAGWYRYRMKWHFYADGRVWPEFSFAAAQAICTSVAHRHHAYWRFDFDLGGTPADDVIRRIDATGGTVLTSEAEFALNGTSDETVWSITDPTGIGYRIEPGEADRRLPVDDFSKTDVLVLRYRVDEIDDGMLATDGENACAFAYEPFLNDESLDGEDTVLWYRSGALHAAGSPFECDIVGPMLRPFGFITEVEPRPGAVEFEAPRPNPTASGSAVRFRVERTQPVTAELYDTSGRRLAVLFDGLAVAGAWTTVQVDGADLPPGTYVVRVVGETIEGTTRLTVVR